MNGSTTKQQLQANTVQIRIITQLYMCLEYKAQWQALFDDKIPNFT